MKTNLQVPVRLALSLVVSLGLHLALAWSDWSVLPAVPGSSQGKLRVSLVPSSALAPQPVVPEKDSSHSETGPPVSVPSVETSPLADATPMTIESSLPAAAVPAVPMQTKLPRQPASQKQLQGQEETPVPKMKQKTLPLSAAFSSSTPGPESVFQSIDLVCAARKRGGTEQKSVEPATPPATPELAAGIAEEIDAAAAPAAFDMSDRVDAMPRYRSNPLPDYPYLARQRHWEGVVWLLVDVSAGGRVTALEVAESSGYGVLDKSALKGVRRWRFEPARKAGIAVSSQVRVPVEFRLQN